MSSSEQFAEDTALGQLAQRLQEEHGIDLSEHVPDDGETFREMVDRVVQEEGVGTLPQAGDDSTYAGAPPVGGSNELQDGQTIHDAAHWLGKPAEETGEFVGGEFVATSAWGGGIIEDDVIPLEHRVYSEGEAPAGEVEASWVLPDGSQIEDTQFQHSDGDEGSYFYYDDSASLDEAYESGYEDGISDGADEAGQAEDES